MDNICKQHLHWHINDEMSIDYSISDVIEDHINCTYDLAEALPVVKDIIDRMERKLESIETDLEAALPPRTK
jgi:Ethanolamine utilization protein EutJ (predicted chaperonin)